MAEELKKITYSDPDHLWVDGNQFISLKRFTEVRKDSAKELNLLQKEVKKLTEENKALRVLLKDVLDNMEDK